MLDLHPAVQHMADKGYERMSLDETAIVHTMRRSIADSLANADLIKTWLQQENPLGLSGPALAEWATGISDWILPTQLRRSNATATGKLTEDDQQQYQDGDGRREASEASRRHSAEQSQSNKASSSAARE
jgi:hypothetical protein